MKHMLRGISGSLRKLPDYKESSQILQAKSFAKIWSSLGFVASIPKSCGERNIRY
jgi:hypothetical protein